MAEMGQNKLSELLRRAQAAHHDFESVELGGEFDEQWPAWYAEYLLENGLAALVGASLDTDTLANLLDRTGREFQAGGGHGDWADFTAQQLLAHKP